MFIKQLTLKGFLSYRDLTTISFTRHLNVIVGSNGTGKSTLLLAIRFAMGYDIPSERLLWLNHNNESKVNIGYVTLTLENEDGHVCTLEKGDVVLRREFNSQKDDIFLNGKHISRHEVLSILEAAGFSRYNPYSFIHQHEIFQLIRMNPNQRLCALKECAGTRLYELRRNEALRSLNDTKLKRSSIDSMLKTINEKVKELKREQEELEECVKCETEKMCLTSVLASKELLRETAQLEKLTLENENNDKKKSQLVKTIDETNIRLKQLEKAHESENQEKLAKWIKKLKQIERDHTRMSLEFKSIKNQEEQLKKDIEKCQIMLRDMEQQNNERQKRFHDLQSMRENKRLQILELGIKIGDLQKHYPELAPCIKDNTSYELSSQQVQEELELKKQDRERLCQLLNETNSQIQQLDSYPTEWDKNLEDSTSCVMKKMDISSGEMTDAKAHLNDICEKNSTTSKHYQEIIEKSATLQKQLKERESEISLARQNLLKTLRPSQLNGYSECLALAKERNWDESKQFLGFLLDHIEVQPRYYKAVESVSGSQLLNILVEDPHIALQLASHLRETQTGYAVLSPLSALTESTNLSEDYVKKMFQNEHVVPLLSVIDADRELLPALVQVFGKYILLKNQDLDLARSIASRGFNVVTIEGDKISKKGTLTGGYVFGPSRLALKMAWSEAKKEYQRIHLEIQELCHILKDWRSQQLEAFVQDQVQQVALQQHEDYSTVVPENKTLLEFQNLDQSRTRRETLVSYQMELTSQKQSLEIDISRLEHLLDIGDPNKKDVMTLEQQGSKDVPLGRSEWEKYQEEKESLELEHQRLTEELNDQRKDLQLSLRVSLTTEREQLKTLTIQLQDCEQQMEALQMQWDVLQQKRFQVESNIEQIKQSQKDSLLKQKQLEDQRQESHSLLDEKQLELSHLLAIFIGIQEQINTLRVKIGTLNVRVKGGSGSSEMMSSLLNLSDKELNQRFSKVVKKLGEFVYVNRSATDHCLTIIRQQEDLIRQRETLYKGEDVILDLIRELDEKKDSTLLRTFENVNAEFHRIFAQLVPGGKGKLVLKRTGKTSCETLDSVVEDGKKDSAELNPAVSEQEALVLSENILSGVDIKVRFSTSYGYTSLHSLSGGQKSTVALALIFALQRIDASPFCILDEVDSHLDVQYRGGVAQFIQSQAQDHQFIVISHKEPMIKAAEWFLKTEMVANGTRVTPITLQEALIASQEPLLSTSASRERYELVLDTQLVPSS